MSVEKLAETVTGRRRLLRTWTRVGSSEMLCVSTAEHLESTGASRRMLH